MNNIIDRINNTYNPNNTSESYNIDFTGGASTNTCRNANLDIMFGFQDIDPMLLSIVTEIFGNIMSGNLPTNVTNALGNWLQLISAVISNFIAQQQYQQSGPGRYYNPIYRNISNPFCSNPSFPDGGEAIAPNKKNKKSSRKRTDERIKELEFTVSNLLKEIDQLKNNK